MRPARRGSRSPSSWSRAALGPEGEVLWTERAARLERAIARLPNVLKEPLILTYLEGCTQQEAADLLNVSVKTIETRAYRARRRLAEQLGLD